MKFLLRVLRASPLLFASVRTFDLLHLLFWIVVIVSIMCGNLIAAMLGGVAMGAAIVVHGCWVIWWSVLWPIWRAVQHTRMPRRELFW